MPVPSQSPLQTLSVVLTREQVRRLRMLVSIRSNDIRTANFSEVLREVVEAGLPPVLRGHVSSDAASPAAKIA